SIYTYITTKRVALRGRPAGILNKHLERTFRTSISKEKLEQASRKNISKDHLRRASRKNISKEHLRRASFRVALVHQASHQAKYQVSRPRSAACYGNNLQ